MTTKPRPSIAGKLFTVAVIGAIGYGIVILSMKGCAAREEMEKTGQRFLAALQKNDVEAAYAELSIRRQRAMPLAEFAALTDHPAYRKHQTAMMGRQESKHPGTCVLGDLVVDGQEWAVQLFFLEEGERHGVDAFGIQAPASVQLGALLEECGYWQGTLLGYSGPPRERFTKPIDP